MKKIVIIGAGPAGLTAAFELLKRDAKEYQVTILEETGVIGVTAPIYNDTISVSKNSEIMDADLIAALQQAFINIGNTDEGKQVIAIYSHNGYQKAQSSDYDNERAAQKLIQELTAAN